jgi:hypothetical protein
MTERYITHTKWIDIKQTEVIPGVDVRKLREETINKKNENIVL